MAISFETSRLNVCEVEGELTLPERTSLLKRVPEILTAPVVENLPPYFHGVTSSEIAKSWLDRMLLQSRLLQVKNDRNEIIGFLFANVENRIHAHIGYLLAEDYWGKGLATELLQGFIKRVTETEQWSKLIGGVDQSNSTSANLLKKLGFLEQATNKNGVIFYEYVISRPQS